MKNYGLILDSPKLEDYFFGGETKIIKNTPLVEKWNPFLPRTELQYNKKFDTWNCVAFSACNCIEISFKYQIDNNLLSTLDIEWLKNNDYLEDEGVNFSDRFVGANAGTKVGEGNTGGNVAEAINEYGLVPESLYQFGEEMDDAEYYTKPPKKLITLGKEFLKRFPIKYERVWSWNFSDAIKYTPIQVYVYAWALKNGEYYMPSDKQYNHAVVLINAQKKQIFDHYEPFIKNLTYNYEFYASGFAYTINFGKKMRLVKTLKDTTVYLIDAKGFKRAFYDEQHFNTVAPILGLAKYRDDNNLKTDWSQIETIAQSDLDSLPLGRPIVLIQ